MANVYIYVLIILQGYMHILIYVQFLDIHTHQKIHIYIHISVCVFYTCHCTALCADSRCQVASMRVLRNLPFHEQHLALADGEDVGFLKMGTPKDMMGMYVFTSMYTYIIGICWMILEMYYPSYGYRGDLIECTLW